MNTTAHPLVRALAANSTGSFGSIIPATSLPTAGANLALFDLLTLWGGANVVPDAIQVIPFGTDAADETFNMRLWGIDKVAAESLYIPQLNAELAVTLGTLSGAAIGTNHLMADTIAVTDGAADNSEWRSLISDGANLASSIILHTRGNRYLAIEFGLGTAAAANAFLRPIGT